jgi:Ca2+-binding RTX toxin-like protein
MICVVRWRGLLGRGFVVVLGWTLLAPSNAFGSTVSRVLENGIGTLGYYASLGETNDIVITRPSNRTITITDAGAQVDAGEGCEQVNVNTVTCSPVDRAEFVLADLDDKVVVVGGPVGLTLFGGSEADDLSLCAECRGTLVGGPGDDTLAGGDAGHFFFGETGNDTIVGGAGADEVSAGAGADTISTGSGRDLLRPGSGNDNVDGGRGRDRVFFDAAPGAVSVDLAAGTVTGWGTKALTRVEDVTGSPYADKLLGNGRANALSGLSDHDVIVGRDGEDALNGGSGQDTLRARDGRRDFVVGGPGHDQARIDSLDAVQSIESTS